MKINFTGHSTTEREVELSQSELNQLFLTMKVEFLNHIEYATFGHSYQTYVEKHVTNLCDAHGVDVDYKKDRIAFFKAVLDNMKNPYQ